MYGKHHDTRVYQHFHHTHSRVPYLDHELFNIENCALRESRNANRRAQTAQQGLERTKEKSQLLENNIREARTHKEKEHQEFIASLQKSQEVSLQKERLSWNDYHREQEERTLGHVKDQLFLQSLLKSNTTKAESRLSTVRRWV